MTNLLVIAHKIVHTNFFKKIENKKHNAQLTDFDMCDYNRR